jgi:hypothetical protein
MYINPLYGPFIVLVRTGIFDGAENDAEDPADFVCADVAAAVDLIIEYES